MSCGESSVNAIWKKRLHQGARLLGWVVGVAAISLAVMMALTQLLLPTLARNPEWVATQLSARLQRPVSFQSVKGYSQPSGPLFVMRDITIGAGDGGTPLRIPEIELKLDLGGWLLPTRHLVNLRAGHATGHESRCGRHLAYQRHRPGG